MSDKYLDNEEKYLELETYWANLFVSIANNSKEDWVFPYYNTEFSNGKKIMDANPIFSAASTKSNKILKVILVSLDELAGVNTWINDRNELVVVCSMSDKNVGKVCLIISEWLNEGNIQS
ncbi:hypothetical protein KZA78_002605 [Listeria monocytogenes]|nr:hypothetical protein [Listeria monocytogenes]EIN5666529.1 hypothetical protein [Listeria monocytogenes]